MLRRVDFFGTDGARTRTLTFGDYREVEGFWRPMSVVMIDVLARGGGRYEQSESQAARNAS